MSKKSNQNESLDEYLRRIYGEQIIGTADAAFVTRKRDILHGPLSLDLALSGGIPDGSICFISGVPKSGKTTLCLELVKLAQKSNRPTFYINIERRCTRELLATINGLDTSKLQVIPIATDKPLSAEDYLNILERVIKDNKNAVIIIDSIAMLSTIAEQDGTVGDNKDMAGPSKSIASFFRRIRQVIDQNNIILICISQLITSRNPRGKKYIEKGGLSIQYCCSVWLNVTWTEQWTENPETHAPDGHNMIVQINSSAMGRPYLPCTIPLRYGHGIDNEMDVAINAENMGLIFRSGSWYNFNDQKFQGIGNLLEYLKSNPDEYRQLNNKIRQQLFGVIYE